MPKRFAGLAQLAELIPLPASAEDFPGCCAATLDPSLAFGALKLRSGL